jgi:hypothetical protein
VQGAETAAPGMHVTLDRVGRQVVLVLTQEIENPLRDKVADQACSTRSVAHHGESSSHRYTRPSCAITCGVIATEFNALRIGFLSNNML